MFTAQLRVKDEPLSEAENTFIAFYYDNKICITFKTKLFIQTETIIGEYVQLWKLKIIVSAYMYQT